MQKGKNVGVIVKRLTLKETYAKRAFAAYFCALLKTRLILKLKSLIDEVNQRIAKQSNRCFNENEFMRS